LIEKAAVLEVMLIKQSFIKNTLINKNEIPNTYKNGLVNLGLKPSLSKI
jgi:hypothetical protein